MNDGSVDVGRGPALLDTLVVLDRPQQLHLSDGHEARVAQPIRGSGVQRAPTGQLLHNHFTIGLLRISRSL
jgi:hypothetical protein